MSKLIRLASPLDATQLLEIYAPSVTDSATSFETEVPSVSEFEGRIRDTLERFPWLVFESDSRIVGYAYAGPHRSRCAYGWSVESSVYVSSSCHGAGVGTELYRVLFELLKSQGVVNIFTGVTQPNEPSNRLHRKLGFTPIGTFRNIGFKLGKWWDVAWWQLRLSEPLEPGQVLPPVQEFRRSVS